MKVFYHRGATPNVGDDLNAVLWQRLLPQLEQIHTAQWLIGIGTILDERLASLPGLKVVCGSGLRVNKAIRFGDDVRFAAVRGPLTAQRLGLPAEVVACDPGFLIGRFWPWSTPDPRRIGLVPHVYSLQHSRIESAAQEAGIEVISPTLPLEEFLARLRRCARVYCESLHGAIFADALRIPWARVRVCSHFYEGAGVSEFKWRDTFSALGLQAAELNRIALLPTKRSWEWMGRACRPVQYLGERRLARLMARHAHDSFFQLTRSEILEERGEYLLARLNALASADAVSRLPRCASAPQPASPSTRVLMFPKDGANSFLPQFSRAIEAAGARVDDFNFWRAFLRRYDVVHIHWPETHLRTHSWWRALGKHVRLAALCLWLRCRGTRVVWMLHNLKSHEKDHWISATLFPLWFPRWCTHVIALTAHGLSCARELHPALRNKPAAIVPHGHYRDVYPRVPSRQESRARLGLRENSFTFLFFGNIRRYKNVPELIRRFRELPDRDTELVIAGLPVLGVRTEDLEALARGDARIRLHLRFIPDDEVPVFLSACDLVVLPFDSILNSGSVLLALSLDRPVLAPRLGALPEIQARVGEKWLRLYDGPLTSALLRDARQRTSRAGERPDLSAFDWAAIGRDTLAFYRFGNSEPAKSASDAVAGSTRSSTLAP